MGVTKGSAISRREFARRAAFASAAASLAPANLLKGEPAAAPAPQASDLPKLPPESQAEVDSRLHAVFTQYGSRLSDAQKVDLTRVAYQGQANLDRLRAYPIQNGDGPSLYLKPLIEHERKPAPKASAPKPAAAAAAPAKP